MFFIALSIFATLLGECGATDAEVSKDDQILRLCTDRADLDEDSGCDSEEESLMEVSLLQTHFSMAGFKMSDGHEASSGAARREANVIVNAQSKAVNMIEVKDGGVNVDFTVQNLQAQRVAELLSAGYDDAQKMEERHWTLLMVVLVFALTVTVAFSTKAAQQRRKGDFDLQHLKIDFQATKSMGATVALKEPCEYKQLPEKCSHSAELRCYSACKQTFRICDECGSRWILQKDNETYTPIAPRQAPPDSDSES